MILTTANANVLENSLIILCKNLLILNNRHFLFYTHYALFLSIIQKNYVIVYVDLENVHKIIYKTKILVSVNVLWIPEIVIVTRYLIKKNVKIMQYMFTPLPPPPLSSSQT